MYTAFNVETIQDFSMYKTKGLELYSKMKKDVRDNIDKYTGVRGEIDGSKMQEDWFPTIKADIFISHSHKDEDLAIGIAGWLYDKFGLVAFIDSCIWGYADDLLNTIDNKYCKDVNSLYYDRKYGTSYNYDLRNNSTSHVHNMLAIALLKMIDKTECIFFINTDNSVRKIENTLQNQTGSPWIYLENNLTNITRRTPLIVYRKNTIETRKELSMKNNDTKYDLNILYEIELSMFQTIDDNIMRKWESERYTGGHPLDYLYMVCSMEFVTQYYMVKFYKFMEEQKEYIKKETQNYRVETLENEIRKLKGIKK